MLGKYFLNIFLVIIFFLIKSVTEKILFEFHTSIFIKMPCEIQRYLNPMLSWRNKWKNGNRKNGESFFGSSWIFIIFTEFKYLLKFVQYNIISIILVNNFVYFNHWIIDYLIYMAIATVFEYVINLILNKKKH